MTRRVDWRDVRAVGGFTLVELLVAAAILLAITAAMAALASQARRSFRAQPEAVDLRQRVRVAADLLQRDLMSAGAGTMGRAGAGPLNRYLPPLRPGRRGTSADPELSFAEDRVSILYAASDAPEAGLDADMASPAAALVLRHEAWCRDATCGFSAGTRALIFDSSGAGFGYDTFDVLDASSGIVVREPAEPALSRAYRAPQAQVTEVIEHQYFLDRTDPANTRLMRVDGSGPAFPVIDHVANLTFTYYADPDPSSVAVVSPGLASCVYGAGTPPVSMLAPLSGTAVHELTPSELTDGPVCGLAPNRFDADLLRVRTVRVRLAVTAGGTVASGPERPVVPDYAVTFDVSPRNLQGIR